MYHNFHHRSLKPRRKLLAIIAIIIGLYLIWSNVHYNYYLTHAVDPKSTENISFLIKSGENAKTVARHLREKDLILSENTFNKYVKKQNLDERIVRGRFKLQKSLTIPEIAKIITDPSKAELILTVTEGEKIKDIDEKLVSLGLIIKGDFATAVKNFNNYQSYEFLDKKTLSKLELPLEGYLFPDTYFLDPSFKSEELIAKMLSNFQKKYEENLKDKIKNGQNLHEIITVASLLEKEVKTEKDYPIVAGIIWKRHEEGWFLNIDATLLYLKNDIVITQSDLEIDSPYNTYKRKGLPPGPIGNPGLKTILSTISPQESPYYFYLTKPKTGEVVYAKTNDEHNLNRSKYLR